MSNGSHYRLAVTLLCSFDGQSTVSIHYLYSTLRVVTRPLDTIHKKATFKDNKISANKIIYRLYRNLKLVGTVYLSDA